MNPISSPVSIQDQQPPQQGFSIDFKRIVARAIQFWYVIVISLLTALGIAFFKNRYAVRIYPVTASILIKEKEETAEGRLLYNNPLVSGFRNYLNEIYLIRSYPMIERTLTKLNFGVAFYKEGNVLTTESYELPFKAYVLNKSKNANDAFYFKWISKDKYELGVHSNEGIGVGRKVFLFNDTIDYQGLKMVFLLNEPLTEAPSEHQDQLVFTYTEPSTLAGSYISRLGVNWAEEGAGVMNLAISGSNPSKEIDFINGLIEQYQLFDLEKKNRVASRTIDFISEQLEGITDSLRHVEQQLERFKNRNMLTDMSVEAQRLYSKLEGIESQRAELIVRNNYFKYLSDYLKQSKNLDQIILPSSVGINDGILSSLIQNMVGFQLQLKLNNRTENPLANELKRKIDEIRKDIVESVKNQQSTDNIRRDYLNKQINDIERQLSYLPVAERQRISIQRNYSLLENLYIFLLQKRAEAGISKASTTTDIEIVNPPMIAGGPISPQPSRNYMMAFVLGLAIPLGAFVLIELLNTKVQSKEDIEKVISIPFIGGVGHKSTENNLEVLSHPKTAIAESFRALRSNLNYFLGKQNKSVIMITSSISGEGKTFTSINLASVISLSGKKTLIVGADMRRPKLFGDFNLKNDKGLSSFLSGMASFEEVIQKTSFPNLDLVSGGPVPPNPAELLLTSKMTQFVTDAKLQYDFVIIDTPPLAIVTDAFVISQLADHTLFLVRQNYTPKDLLRTAEDFYRSGKLKNISLVLNDIYKSGPGYGYGYGYSYSYGYSYGVGNSKRGSEYYS
ncbi:GumC family protein [Chryseosolibacter indicus]|uniref:non-specific protein-tyrosine kinase n=1 Tax=Chryseosolibacter indicus TaxID=2782351 RepID=A0ABS5VV17_9BACT|nr:tyrosine-protein kinase [Chryseosolibacter indicus]MBT1704888.1 polysaccharide biosynthesis tyrosine autokinase [Chryseosolibacter indicus]